MKRSTTVVVFLLLLAFGLRVWDLSAQSIWWDEAFTWQTSSHGLANFWQMLLTGDRNPPLYFVSVAAWGSVAGWSEFSLRFVSVAWSMVGLAFLFNLAKRLYNTSAGLWTLGLATVAPALVVYAQEARMYAAFFALTAATLYFAWRVYERRSQQSHRDAAQSAISNQKLTWAFLLCEAGLLLTHYFAIPLVVTLNVFVLIILLRRRARFPSYARWISGQILAALPIMIWTVIVFATPGSLIIAKEPPPDPISFVYQVGILWLTGIRDLGSAQGHLILPALGLMVVVAIGAWRANSSSTRKVLAFSAISLVVALVLTSGLTSFHPRYLLPYSIFLFVLLGGALSNLRLDYAKSRASRIGDWVVGGLALLLTIFLIIGGWLSATAPAYAKDDARGMAAYLKQHAAADDVIVVEANDYTLNYYDHGPAQTKMITATSEPEALLQLQNAIGTARRAWLPHWAISTQDAGGYWPFLLEQSGSLRGRTSFQGYDLAEYVVQSPLRDPTLEPTVTDEMITHRSNVAGQGTDGALTFALTWQLPVKFFDSARTSTRLVDASGTTLSAHDRMLLDREGRTTDRWSSLEPVTNYYVLPVPPGTPPGTYTITAQLYNVRDVLAHETVGIIELPRRLDTSDPYSTLAGYDWQVPSNSQIAPELTLDSYAVSFQKPSHPMPIDVTLRWRKTGDTQSSTPRLRLAQGNHVWSETGSTLMEQDYPVGQWVESETVIDRLKIEYPPVRGPVELQVGQGDQWTTLTTLQLDESQIRFDPPSMQHTQSAQFGGFAGLSGYDLRSSSLSAERPLDLILYWRATNTEPITTPYTVFTQILAPDGHLVAQHDAPPAPPSTQWVPGQIVSDNHSVKVIDPAYRGPAMLIVGWYNSASVERVPVQGGGDFVTLSVPVQVEDQ